jgi:streptogramin lyase
MAALLSLILTLASPHAVLSRPPAVLHAGRPWRATLIVRPAPSLAPTVTARHAAGKPLRFRARRISSGRFRVVLRLPRAGRWSLAARISAQMLPLRSVRVVSAPAPVSPLPGAHAFRVCGGASIPYTQNGLAVGFGSAWVVCTPQQRVERVDATSGRVVASIRVPAPVWAISAGEGGGWAIARDDSTLYRISPASNRISARVALDAPGVYLWADAGAVWVADDADRTLIRVDPARNRVVARLPVGDGPSGLAFDGASLWLVSHRENSLDRIDPATNRVTRVGSGLAPAETTAAERVAALAGSLWITGRGLDLLRFSMNGSLLGRTELGPAAMDVVSDGSSLWVPAYTPAAARRGNPVTGAVLRIDSGGRIANRVEVARRRRLFVDGFAAEAGRLWVLDGVAGLLLRLPT